MFETERWTLRTFARPGPHAAGLHTMFRSYPTEPVVIDEANYPVDSYRHGIVVTGRGVSPTFSVPAITVDSSYAALVPITLMELDVYHMGIALKIDGDCSCVLKVEGNVSLAGSIAIQGRTGTLVLEAVSGAVLRGIGVCGEGFSTAVSCKSASAIFQGGLTLGGAGNFEFIASGSHAGIRCPDGALVLEGASKLTASGGCPFRSGPGGAGIYVKNMVVTTSHPDGLTSVGGNAELYEGGCGIVAQSVIADGRIIACGGGGVVGGDGCWLRVSGAGGVGTIGGMGDVILRGGSGTSASSGCGLWIQNCDKTPIDIVPPVA